MKRRLCLLLVLMFILACSGQAFADSDVLYCRMCGSQIPTDSRICPYCGVAVVHVDSKASSNASAAAKTAAAPAQTVQNSAQTVQGPFNTTLDYSGRVVVSNKVRVTKSPTSESVPYGGSCMFIAHAANATGVTWYLANTDGSCIVTAYEAADNVSGLYVSGGNTDTLSLSGIPSWMNGYQVQACFTGEGGPVYTDIAKIWTYQETVKEESCAPWWWYDYKRCHPELLAPPPRFDCTSQPAAPAVPNPPAMPVGANPPAMPGGGNPPPPPPSV